MLHEVKTDELNANDGLKRLLELLGKQYKNDELSSVYEAWGDFDNIKDLKIVLLSHIY